MMQFLITFEFEHYCQGYEWARKTLLVTAHSYEEACKKIAASYDNARNFTNDSL